MDFGYDIFRKLEDGAPLWIKQVSTFDGAKSCLEELVSNTHGEYFIRDASSGEIVFRLATMPHT